ncbi:hypothetical protein DFP72DRAFT_1058369 [Ephemerocybe angulata]|uniref:Uncharacterized protein n=1 Tax=Ephemerocybe angulata TaxID=980116 RepID=A0A8H6IHZ7_9AGAR|nr:hypothetical protein DFP72DRAFT_1058369 [Tulosesus angulatus]
MSAINGALFPWTRLNSGEDMFSWLGKVRGVRFENEEAMQMASLRCRVGSVTQRVPLMGKGKHIPPSEIFTTQRHHAFKNFHFVEVGVALLLYVVLSRKICLPWSVSRFKESLKVAPPDTVSVDQNPRTSSSPLPPIPQNVTARRAKPGLGQDLLRSFTHRNLTTVYLDTSLPFLHSFLAHASMPRCQSLQVVVRGVNPEDPTLQSTLEQMMGHHVRPTLAHPDGGKLTIRLPDPFSVECGLSYLDSEVQDIILTLSVASERWSDPEAALWSTHALTVESALAFWLPYSTTITELRVEAGGDIPAHHEAHIAPFVRLAKYRMEGLVGGQVQRHG